MMQPLTFKGQYLMATFCSKFLGPAESINVSFLTINHILLGMSTNPSRKFVISNCFFFFLRERERESMQGGTKENERENLKQAPCPVWSLIGDYIS